MVAEQGSEGQAIRQRGGAGLVAAAGERGAGIKPERRCGPGQILVPTCPFPTYPGAHLFLPPAAPPSSLQSLGGRGQALDGQLAEPGERYREGGQGSMGWDGRT